MVVRGRSRHGGLTLLEAVLALVILSGVMVVSLQVRTQSMLAEQRLTQRHREHRDVDLILRELEAGVLGEPTVDQETRIRTWTGLHLDEPFTLRSVPILVANPVRQTEGSSLKTSVTMWRYELRYRSRTVEFLHYH